MVDNIPIKSVEAGKVILGVSVSVREPARMPPINIPVAFVLKQLPNSSLLESGPYTFKNRRKVSCQIFDKDKPRAQFINDSALTIPYSD